jgi:uncharacterized protein YuzE
MAPHLDAVLAAMAMPDHREPDERPHRARFYKRDAGPCRWLMVVVDFEEQPARVVTALGMDTKVARRIDAVNVNITGLVFDRANYDVDGDVLYLARGEAIEASDAALTPEDHGIRYDSEGHGIGVKITSARWLLDRDGHVTITLPQEVQVAAGDLAGALS